MFRIGVTFLTLDAPMRSMVGRRLVTAVYSPEALVYPRPRKTVWAFHYAVR